MKLVLFFLTITALPIVCMHKLPTSRFTRNCVPYNLTNQALIKSLANRKQTLKNQTHAKQQSGSWFVIHKKAGMFNKFDATLYIFSSKLREKITGLGQFHNPIDPCGPDSILDDKENVQIRSSVHADESTKWHDYC